MSTMKTSELTGAQLDYWVAKAEGKTPTVDDQMRFMPASDWSQGGPIIERERIGLAFGKAEWFAEGNDPPTDYKRRVYKASTPLVAAMRAYVASKFGDEVDEWSTGR
jgi:hypothetical protein